MLSYDFSIKACAWLLSAETGSNEHALWLSETPPQTPQSRSQRPRSFWLATGIATSDLNLWPSPTPEVRDSRTSRHSAHAQSQVSQIWLVLVSMYCVHTAVQNRNVVGPCQGSRYFQRMTKGTPGEEVVNAKISATLTLLAQCDNFCLRISAKEANPRLRDLANKMRDSETERNT